MSAPQLPDAPVVVLAGGTGGAKLARGVLDHAGADLVVIANTGDDTEIHGGLVSPDPDLCTFWLADRIDERGWGLEDDTFAVMDALRALGEDVWFNLGDRDLALCIRRARRLAEGARLTEVLAENAAAYGVPALVLPPSDSPVRTQVRTDDRWWDFQEFMIRRLRETPAPVVQDVAFRGAEDAVATPEVLQAIRTARAVVVGPSNPVISISPILAVPGVREALRDTAAPIVAVAPLVDGQVLKGPTESFLRWAGVAMDARGVARIYDGLLDGLLTDETVEIPGLAVRTANVLMGDAATRASVAAEALDLCAALSSTDRSAA
ncbi:2-phospho-L-lactate transferase CofD family protein [Patulibacter sp.]|uniref:2-phospho-L-lactate transferase CofD family protein n=1 Tax=Patulibacter sp. TaxID=1912859 RepID=UPI0027270464|nr:2-phospho-L-lactate transferase CofD family protein [Patulibacter sp.]MDO9409088.1 2-phospho-L-lactate transferase CofD family protein [Patulibacter sp.]